MELLVSEDVKPFYQMWLIQGDQVRTAVQSADLAVQTNKGLNVLKAKEHNLQNVISRYEEKFSTLCDALNSERTELDPFVKTYNDTKQNVLTCMDKVAQAIDDIVASNATNPTTPGPIYKLHLPEIRIPEFQGEVEHWPQFWELFCSLVDSRTDLPVAVKFTYLKNALKGPSAKLIAGFAIDAHNYDQAKQVLLQTYKDDDRSRRRLVQQLLSLKAPKHECREIKEFRIQYNQILRSLKAFQDTTQSMWLMQEILLGKVSMETQAFLFNRENSQYFSFEAFDKGLQVLVDLLETTTKRESSKSQDHITKLKGEKTAEKSRVMWQATTPATQTRTSQCAFCNEAHNSSQCPTYLSLDERKNSLYQSKKCLKCGASNHFANNCKKHLFCFKCKGKHWTPLCLQVCKTSRKPTGDPKFKGVTNQSTSPASSLKTLKGEVTGLKTDGSSTVEIPRSSVANKSVLTQSVSTHCGKSVALPTAKVIVKSRNKRRKSASIRCFFDTGAQKSFVHPQIVEDLGLHPTKHTVVYVAAFGQEPSPVKCPVVKLDVALGKRIATIDFLVTNRVSMFLNVPGLSESIAYLKNQNICLADPDAQDEITDISAVIGADNLSKFISGTRRVAGINLLHSPGGHIIYGTLPYGSVTETVHNQSVTVARVSVQEIEVDSTEVVPVPEPPVHELWELEAISINNERLTPDERHAVSQFAESIQYEDNKYWVRLPWKRDRESLPTNFRVAMGQYLSLMRNLQADPDKLAHYNKVIQEYEDQNFIEKVVNPSIKGHYLPHHAVRKDSITTPLRVVFNASSKKGPEAVSLNDMLDTGPSLTVKLVDSLLNFRTGKFGLTADISKAFLRVGLQETDRDFVRFLWTSDIKNPSAPPQTYRFKSVLFGSTSSPFLLQATLYKHFEDCSSKITNMLKDSFYVDNFSTTTDEESDLYYIHEEAGKCLAAASMPLQEWNSNSDAFNDFINDVDRKDTPSILGVKWDTAKDTLFVNTVPAEHVTSLTKRRALSICSSVYDPLGLISPVTVNGKLLIRDLWKSKLGWDENISEDFLSKFNELFKEFRNVDSLHFPRSVLSRSDPDNQMHIFCDASSSAYGAVVYIVGSKFGSNLLMSRSRVAPLKGRSIPQLELTAILLGCRMAKYVTTALHIQLPIYIWSDNLPSLQWVANNNSDIVYVKNRVGEILELKSELKFSLRHVGTKENPADLLSRGCGMRTLIVSALWMKGPEWLSDCNKWPDTFVMVHAQEILTQKIPLNPVKSIFPVDKFSTLRKLFNVTEYVFKFLKIIFPGKFPSLDPSSYWIRKEQKVHYPLVYEALQLQSRENKYKDSNKFISDLCLFLDEKDIIRSRGRLSTQYSSHDMNHPMLLPPKSFLCKLFILDRHFRNHHIGVQECLSLMRDEFWIPHGRQTVKQVVNKCVTCKYNLRKTFPYPGPPPLPVERVVFDRPFQHTAVDLTGAIKLKINQEEVKYYICLFTCTATRAVHLELVDSLSAEAFILCLRRFVSRCSLPEKLISDNGTNFVATNRFLLELQSDSQVKEYLQDHRLTWYFSSPRAPWQGGLFERMVGIVKNCLNKAFHKRAINANELQTLLTEVEAIVNNRPLLYIGDEVRAVEVLTPSHLLYGRKLRLYPTLETHDYEYDSVSNTHVLLAYHNKLNKVINLFTRVWEHDYLQALREKHYSQSVSSLKLIPRVGEIVLVCHGPDKNSWNLGKIVELIHGRDNEIREVKVLFKGQVSRRTVDKLIPLEVEAPDTLQEQSEDLKLGDSDSQDEGVRKDTVVNQEVQSESVRPRRQAAVRAERHRRELIEQDLL